MHYRLIQSHDCYQNPDELKSRIQKVIKKEDESLFNEFIDMQNSSIHVSCEHPDLEEFIGVKSDLDKVTKANISVRITDKFMAAVKNKQPFTLSFTRSETGETITKTIDAYEMFHKLCEMNWDYAEPGMLFWDRIENWNLLSCDNNFHYAGTNPLAI